MALDTPQEAAQSGAVPGTVSLRGQFDISADQPLPGYDSPPAMAYACSQTRDLSRHLMALVCDPKLPPRTDVIPALRRIDHGCMVKVLDWGVVDWPLEGRRCPVLIVERPQGQRVFRATDTETKPLPEELVMRLFLQPMAQILAEIQAQGQVHRAIRPDNLFYDDAQRSRILLGECISTPPALTQPVAYETIEAGMAVPAGRGEGTIANDLYAIGATAIALLIGRAPCHDMRDDEIIDSKMQYGSYTALVRRARVSLTMMEVLRGLLHDDPKERWTVDDLNMWISGRRLSPKPPGLPTRAARGFVFMGKEHLTAREVAEGMSRHWDKAAEAIHDGSLDAWLRRSLSDEERTEAVNTAKTVSVVGDDANDRITARVIIALDPFGPVRYRDFRATVEGVGNLFGAFVDDQEARRLFVGVMRGNLLPFLVETRGKPTPEHVRQLTLYDKARSFMDRMGMGYGVERVAYELNPTMPCRSPLFETDFVVAVDELLPAYERLAERGGIGKSRLVDRHIAAFIAARFKGAIGGELRDLENATDENVPLVAAVRLLSAIQDSQPNRSFPALCELAAAQLRPTIQRFHSRRRRRGVEGEMVKVVRAGRLGDLLEVIDNPMALESDQRSFDHAVRLFSRSLHELRQLQYERTNRGRIARDLGAWVASLISGFVGITATLTICIIALL
ncbi:MAG: hypothetical protein AB7G39_05025 [Alphaproteobacteria bacterium]